MQPEHSISEINGPCKCVAQSSLAALWEGYSILSVLLMRVGLILGVLCYSFVANELLRSTREEGIGQGIDIF